MAKFVAVVNEDLILKEIASLVRIAEASIKTVSIEKNGTTVDCKSILGVFSLGIRKGDNVTFESEDAGILTLIAGFI
jgi:phosphotransferase system HPr (HPr) family protein